MLSKNVNHIIQVLVCYIIVNIWWKSVSYKMRYVFFTITQSVNRNINGYVQERHISSALALELCLCCINPSILA